MCKVPLCHHVRVPGFNPCQSQARFLGSFSSSQHTIQDNFCASTHNNFIKYIIICKSILWHKLSFYIIFFLWETDCCNIARVVLLNLSDTIVDEWIIKEFGTLLVQKLCKNLFRIHFCCFNPGQNCRHFADYIFRCIFVNEKICILIKIYWSLFLRVQLTIIQHWFSIGAE